MKVKEGRPVGEDRVDVDLLDVGDVGHGVHGQEEVTDMLEQLCMVNHEHRIIGSY